MGYGIISLAVNYRGISFLLTGVGLSLCILAAGCKKKDDSSPVAPANPNNLKRMFVTQTVFDGNLGGLAGANAKCATAASEAGLGGNWVAWLSDSSTNAIARVTPVAPWYLVDGETLVFQYHTWPGAPDLPGPSLATTPSATLNMDEYGKKTLSFQNYSVWTGSILSGVLSGTNCGDWLSNNASDLGDRGSALGNLKHWSGRDTSTPVPRPEPVSCREFLHLYCIEQ